MDQSDVVCYVLDALEHLNLPHAVVGSYASSAWGEPRTTHDVDIVAQLSEQQARELCTFFSSPEWYVSLPAVLDAVRKRSQFNIIHPASGYKADVMVVGRDEFTEQQLARRIRVRLVGGREFYSAHPEDVILGKLRYYKEGGSDKHLRDIAAMLDVSPERIDRDNVARWAERLGVLEIWQTVVDRIDLGDRSQT